MPPEGSAKVHVPLIHMNPLKETAAETLACQAALLLFREMGATGTWRPRAG